MIYEKWPDHFKAAQSMRIKLGHDPSFYDSIALCGMGGSATSCDVLGDLLQAYGSTPSIVLRGSPLPPYVGKGSLVIINSVSGNTEETVSMMKQAASRNAEIICISAGGRLRELAKAGGHKHLMIPDFSLPRASLPYLLMPGLKLIDPFLKQSIRPEISNIYKTLSKLRNSISVKVDHEVNVAKKMAAFLEKGFAFCFTSPSLASVGTRFKNSLNENAKVHCLNDSVLEASHNEIVPFTFDDPSIYKVLLLRWAGDSIVTSKRFEKIRSFFAEIEQPLMELTAPEKSLVSAIISSIYILDYTTIYMAVARGIDPAPTPAIDILKNID
jgi:glucose/mannose-6-phosphate isomerase